jgi:DNA-binding NarL/FixJ family response regulator
LIADDHLLARRGLRAVIESHVGWTVCAEACTGREAVEMAAQFKPDIAVLDITMPELNGIETARRLQKSPHRIEVLLLSAHYSDQLVREAVDAGVRGYIMKTDSGSDLLLALEALAQHKPFFTSLATQVVLRDIEANHPRGLPGASGENPLTSREREALQLLSEGKTSKEVASALSLSVKTIDTHRANIMRKLKFHNVADLVRYAIRNLIIEP